MAAAGEGLSGTRKRLFVPLWHPPEGGFAGGFVRAKRMLESMTRYEIVAADTDSTDIVLPPAAGRLTRIPAKALRSRRFHALGRALNWLWVSLGLLFAGIRAEKIDAVYVPTGDIPAASLPGFIVAALRRVPVISVTFDGPGTVLWSINRLLHRRFTAVITLSQASRERLRRDGLNVPIEFGSIGVDEPPADRNGATTIEWDAVFVGRHTPEKGVFDALEIWRRVVERSPRRRRALAGSASPPMRAAIERRISALGLDGAVSLLGQLDEDSKWQLYRTSQLCLFPSRHEGWGLVPLEAHACGVPVVAYDLPAYAENIARSAGATLCAVGDYDAAALAVLRYLEGGRPDPQGLRAFARRFSWEAAVTHEEALLERLLSTTAAPGSS